MEPGWVGLTSIHGRVFEGRLALDPTTLSCTMASVFRLSIAGEASLTRLWLGLDAIDFTCRFVSLATGLDLIGAGRRSG